MCVLIHFFFFSSRRRHTRLVSDWSSDVCSSDLHGLCFSVQPGVAVPPSLDNIFKEIQRDLGIARPDHGCLLPWARQGVLLLNAVLTVEDGRAGAHQGKGLEGFTYQLFHM